MTKPNDFILNSDYLPLMQVNNAEFTAYFPAETIPSGSAWERTQDFTVPASSGAVDTILMSLDGSNYIVGGVIVPPDQQSHVIMSISVYRQSPTTMRVKIRAYTSISGGYLMPAKTVKVKVSSFRPPDVF